MDSIPAEDAKWNAPLTPEQWNAVRFMFEGSDRLNNHVA